MYEEKIPIVIRMEEEEESQEERESIGFRRHSNQEGKVENLTNKGVVPISNINQILLELMNERRSILDNNTLKSKEKLKLLESNRKTIVLVKGGSIRKTENVVYSVLIFSGFLILTLAALNTFANLSTEITLTFMGTVLGGTIATITQKIGKL